MSLTRKTVHAAVWLGGARLWSQVLNLTIGVALARLLTPDDYGLLGMVMVITGLFGMLSDLGLSTAVVQKQDLSQQELSSVFWFNVGVAVLFSALLAACSPLAASFYSQPEVMPVMCVTALSFPISAFASVQSALLQKEMRFKQNTKIYVLSSLAAGVLALLAAWAGWKVWALVWQSISSAVFSAAGLWMLSKWRPDFRFSMKSLERIWGFSLNLTGFQIVNYFARRADNFLIGRYLGTAPLGFYTLAYTLMVYPISNLMSVAQGVLVPAMSQVQTEPRRVAGAYVRACRYMGFLILPAMVGLALLAREAVVTLYGPKWSETGRILQVLAWVGVFQPFVSLIGALFVARGFTRYFFWWGIIASTITVSGFIVGLQWGVTGVAMAYLTTESFLTVFGMPFLYRKVDVSVRALLTALAVPGLAAGCMGLIVFAAKLALISNGVARPAVVLAICVCAGCLSYALVLLFLRNYFWNDLKGEFRRIFGKTNVAVAST